MSQSMRWPLPARPTEPVPIPPKGKEISRKYSPLYNMMCFPCMRGKSAYSFREILVRVHTHFIIIYEKNVSTYTEGKVCVTWISRIGVIINDNAIKLSFFCDFFDSFGVLRSGKGEGKIRGTKDLLNKYGLEVLL